jgi:hypothetical protein
MLDKADGTQCECQTGLEEYSSYMSTDRTLVHYYQRERR